MLTCKPVIEKQINVNNPLSEIAKNENINIPFNSTELITAIKNKKDKATGADKVAYSLIKQLPHKEKIAIMDLINQSWKSGSLPDELKIAQIIPFKKTGKDHPDPNNYRPIALTSHNCKTMETMVNNRLK